MTVDIPSIQRRICLRQGYYVSVGPSNDGLRVLVIIRAETNISNIRIFVRKK